jgi:hypothetical protein
MDGFWSLGTLIMSQFSKPRLSLRKVEEHGLWILIKDGNGINVNILSLLRS